MNKLLTLEEILQVSTEFKLNVELVRTVIRVESSGSGFDSVTGKIKIQFEPHWYKHYTGTWINNGVRPQKEEWEAFTKAYEANAKMAMMSTSWGLGQVMGFNHTRAGYKSVKAMVDHFVLSEYYQLRGMVSFIATHKKMYTALKNRDWGTFAYYYNGKEFKKYKYDSKLEKTYKEILDENNIRRN
jgi:hypothetical protein